MRNYHFVSDNAIVIITAKSEDEAKYTLGETVKDEDAFRLSNISTI